LIVIALGIHSRCDMQSSGIIRPTDYRLSQEQSTFAGEVYSAICIEWATAHYGLGLT